MTVVRPSLPDRRRRELVRAAVVAGILATVLAPSPARAGSWRADLSVSYQQGDYGSDETTTILSVPLTLKRFFAAGEISVTVPYVSIETDGDVVVVDGTPQINGGGDGGSASGLGDIVLKGKYAAVEQKGRLPSVDLVCRLKLPTAHDDLGTGEADFGLGAELSYRFGGTYFAMADFMHTFIGDPPDTNFRNRSAWDLGLGWRPKPAWTLSIYYDYASSLRSNPAAQSVMFYAAYRLRPDVRLFALLEQGISRTASDFGITTGVKYSY